ncbi:unnamed protein product [Symbiodinium pilosum]|uniref:WW domain-containing protein n=1 Tax=Symbiodinium pilosum TaxID=2952 RepID=A0A812U624_SYMPI|nr:unnamed protein product [Symbiodinium pilosum]
MASLQAPQLPISLLTAVAHQRPCRASSHDSQAPRRVLKPEESLASLAAGAASVWSLSALRRHRTQLSALSLLQRLFAKEKSKAECIDDEIADMRRQEEEDLQNLHRELGSQAPSEQDLRVEALRRQQEKLARLVGFRKSRRGGARRTSSEPGRRPTSPPAPWRSYLDVNTGCWYYHNEETNVTTWDLPTALMREGGLKLGSWGGSTTTIAAPERPLGTVRHKHYPRAVHVQKVTPSLSAVPRVLASGRRHGPFESDEVQAIGPDCMLHGAIKESHRFMGSRRHLIDGWLIQLDAYWRGPAQSHSLGGRDAYPSYAPGHLPSSLTGRDYVLPSESLRFEAPKAPKAPTGLLPNPHGPTLQPGGLSIQRDPVYERQALPVPYGLSAGGDGRMGSRFLPSNMPNPGHDFGEAPFHQTKFSRLDFNAGIEFDARWPSSAPRPFSYKVEAPGQTPLPLPGSFPSKPFTLLIFDWDDTLMCSSAINANEFLPHQYSQLESLVEQVLLTAMRLGETCIVTNADEMWVTESARRYMPRVLPILSRMTVVSARRRFERTWPGDVFAWKREAFRQVLSSWQANALASGGIDLIVLGDSIVEMEAAHTSSAGIVSPTAVKTVKFKEVPTVEELLEQLAMMNQELASIVADDRSSYRNLASRLSGFGALSSPTNRLPDTAYGTMSMSSYSYLGVPLSVP